jgi:hypothetical protein
MRDVLGGRILSERKGGVVGRIIDGERSDRALRGYVLFVDTHAMRYSAVQVAA